MRKYRLFIALLGLAWILNACGANPAMQGAESSEEGSVSESGKGNGSGSGDSTSFSSDNVEKVDEYVIRRGDNLWNIAAKASVYHSGWLYPLILKANRGKIKDPKDLPVGLLLKIPRGLPQGDYDVAREEAMAGVYESEVGSLQEMKTDIPVATPQPAQGTGKPYKASKDHHLLLWIVGLALLGAGAWKFMAMRRAAAAEAAQNKPPI
jgi:hypothetical protein